MVAERLRNGADVIAVGPIYDADEQGALLEPLPIDTAVMWVVIDASVQVTFARVQGDPTRGRSKERSFHFERHARFRDLLDGIPADRRYDSAQLSAEAIAEDLAAQLVSGRRGPGSTRRPSRRSR